MQQLGTLKELVGTWQELQRRVDDLSEMVALVMEESDTSLQEDIQGELKACSEQLEKLEIEATFSGDYDRRNVLLAIHAGAGGTESQDWASMLLRMYLRWAEQHSYRTEILDTSPGEEAGIKGVVVEIRGKHAYGYLKSEHGVHRLVRLSPFDADHARHTSFAKVEALPEAQEEEELEIVPEDLKIDAFKASGPGGQHMQKSSTAIRITHVPTGLVVTCQDQRSQLQNKESALRILYARLLEKERKRKEEEQAKLRGKHVDASWGNQIRSYVLQPYKLVKDHRTGHEVKNTDAVLDGNLDEFMSAYLHSLLGKEK